MIQKYIKEIINLNFLILKDKSLLNKIKIAIKTTRECLQNGNKILVAGNGGSAAESQHFATEITGRYKIKRRGYPAIALTTDSSILTAWSNDFEFETVFSRQIEALGNSGDLFFGISTSGNSKNILNAVKIAKKNKIKTICLLGNNGGKLKNLSDISIIIPSKNTPRIQEIQMSILHIICEEGEKSLI